ncbi:MAG: M20/M25/M40 family metallo-hydrolase [Candidatus Micrarchaeota archaeon]
MSSDAEQMSLLKKLVSINSVFPGEERIARFLASHFGSFGFKTTLQEFSPGRYNVIAQKGPRKSALLLFGHFDTVPPYNYGSRDPFKLTEKGDRLMGLGAWDMKAGVAIISACAKECDTSKRGIRIVLSADEENISEGTWFAQKNGDFKDCSFALSPEIPDQQEEMKLQATAPVLSGRRGRCVYKFKVRGVGSHGAGTGGISAVDLGMKLVAALERVPLTSSRGVPCRLFIRKFQAESTSLAVPTEAVLEADVHYVPPYNPKSFLQHIKKHLKGLKFPKGCSYSVEIPKRKTPYLPAYDTNRNNPLVKKFASLCKGRLGACNFSYGLTVADENVVSVERIPVITLGPVGGEAHNSNEWLSKKNFLALSREYPKIVQGLLD